MTKPNSRVVAFELVQRAMARKRLPELCNPMAIRCLTSAEHNLRVLNLLQIIQRDQDSHDYCCANHPARFGLSHSSRVLVLAAFFAIYVVWGSTYLAIRFAIESIPPLVTAGIRHTTASLVLLAWAYARGFRFRMDYYLKGALALGVLFFVIGHGTLHWAEQYVNSGLAALLIATEPMFILVIGSLMGTEHINWKNGLGFFLGLWGVFLPTGRDLWDHSSLAVGIAAVLVGSASWSVWVCLSPEVKLPDEPVARAALPVICGGTVLLIIAAVSGETGALHWSNVSGRSIAGLVYLIVFGSIVAFTAYTCSCRGSRRPWSRHTPTSIRLSPLFLDGPSLQKRSLRARLSQPSPSLPPSCSFSREPVSSARNCRRSGLLENFGGSHFDYDRCSRRARAQPSLFAWRARPIASPTPSFLSFI